MHAKAGKELEVREWCPRLKFSPDFPSPTSYKWLLPTLTHPLAHELLFR